MQVVILVVLTVAFFIALPFIVAKSMENVQQTKTFTKEQTEELLRETISLLESDYSYEEVISFINKKIDAMK